MVLETFDSMRTDLETKKKAIQRVWSKRQVQIERVTNSMVTICGELQAIAEGSLSELDVEPLMALGAELRTLPVEVGSNDQVMKSCNGNSTSV